MKRNYLLLLLVLALLMACNKPVPEVDPTVAPDDTTKTVVPYQKGESVYESDDECTNLVFEDQLGNDLESALQALIASRAELTALGENLYVKKSEMLGVELKDSAKVYSLMFYKRVSNSDYPLQPLYAASDAIDTQGCYYSIQWCGERLDVGRVVYKNSELTFEKNYGATFDEAYINILPDIDAYVQLLAFDGGSLDFGNYIIKQTNVIVLDALDPEVEYVRLDIYVYNTAKDRYSFFKEYSILDSHGNSYIPELPYGED